MQEEHLKSSIFKTLMVKKRKSPYGFNIFHLGINTAIERKRGNVGAKGWEIGGLISFAKLTLEAEIKFNLLAKIWLSSH